MVGGEPVFVRSAAIDTETSKLEGFSEREFDGWFIGLQDACP